MAQIVRRLQGRRPCAHDMRQRTAADGDELVRPHIYIICCCHEARVKRARMIVGLSSGRGFTRRQPPAPLYQNLNPGTRPAPPAYITQNGPALAGKAGRDTPCCRQGGKMVGGPGALIQTLQIRNGWIRSARIPVQGFWKADPEDHLRVFCRRRLTGRLAARARCSAWARRPHKLRQRHRLPLRLPLRMPQRRTPQPPQTHPMRL